MSDNGAQPQAPPVQEETQQVSEGNPSPTMTTTTAEEPAQQHAEVTQPSSQEDSANDNANATAGGVAVEQADAAAGSSTTPVSEPFTPRSILRRNSSAAASGAEDDNNGAATRSASAMRRARIQAEVSYMADVLYEPTYDAEATARKMNISTDRYEQLYIDAAKLHESLEAKRAEHAKKEDARHQKVCTFDPLTTRKKGKGGKEASQHPPYRTFDEFINEQQRWLSNRPKRLEKLEKQAEDIREGKRDARGEMGKTTKALIARMQKEQRYLKPDSEEGWEQRFNDFLVRKSGPPTHASMMMSGGGDPSGIYNTSSGSMMYSGDVSGSGTTPVSPIDGGVDITSSKRRHYAEPVHPFSPVISAYAASKAARERGERASLSPFRQRWEEDPAAYAQQPIPYRATRASDTVFEKLYADSSVRAAASKILADSFIENERSHMFKPRTNESWQFSSASHRGSVSGVGDGMSQFGDGSYITGGIVYAHDGTPIALADERTTDGGGNNSLAGGPRHPDVVVDTLLNKGEEYKERRERRRQLLEESKEQFTFKPQTNQRSHKILADYAKRAEEELTAELARQTLAAMNGDDGEFDAPDTLPEGVTGIQAPKPAPKFNVNTFMMRHERAAALRQAKLAAVAEQRDYEELHQCSFRPALAEKSLRGFSPAGPKRQNNLVSPGSIASAYSANKPLNVSASRRLSTSVRESPSSPLDSRHKPLSRNTSAMGFNASVKGAATPSTAARPTTRPTATNMSGLNQTNNAMSSSSSFNQRYLDANNNTANNGIQQRQQQQRPTSASTNRSGITSGGVSTPNTVISSSGIPKRPYTIPVASVEPTERKAPMGASQRGGSNASSTASHLHEHSYSSGAATGAGGRGTGMGGMQHHADAYYASQPHGDYSAIVNPATADEDDDSQQYLNAIEDEMQDVLADWRSAARGVVGNL